MNKNNLDHQLWTLVTSAVFSRRLQSPTPRSPAHQTASEWARKDPDTTQHLLRDSRMRLTTTGRIQDVRNPLTLTANFGCAENAGPENPGPNLGSCHSRTFDRHFIIKFIHRRILVPVGWTVAQRPEKNNSNWCHWHCLSIKTGNLAHALLHQKLIGRDQSWPEEFGKNCRGRL